LRFRVSLDAELAPQDMELVRVALETDDDLVMRMSELSQVDQWVLEHAQQIDHTEVPQKLVSLAQQLDVKRSSNKTAPVNNVVHISAREKWTADIKNPYAMVSDASDYALLRAAELTQQQGYDWFVVTSKETFVESEKQQPSSFIGFTQTRQIERNCGLLTCETRNRPSTEVGVNINNDINNNRKEVYSILEIRMGKGVKLIEDSYGAQDVVDNLSEKTNQN
jgi:hypothetical protein